jgi:hypothetical protein
MALQMTQHLKRAPIGWNQDHFDMLEDGVIVVRIFKVPAPQESTSFV